MILGKTIIFTEANFPMSDMSRDFHLKLSSTFFKSGSWFNLVKSVMVRHAFPGSSAGLLFLLLFSLAPPTLLCLGGTYCGFIMGSSPAAHYLRIPAIFLR